MGRGAGSSTGRGRRRTQKRRGEESSVLLPVARLAEQEELHEPATTH